MVKNQEEEELQIYIFIAGDLNLFKSFLMSHHVLWHEVL